MSEERKESIVDRFKEREVVLLETLGDAEKEITIRRMPDVPAVLRHNYLQFGDTDSLLGYIKAYNETEMIPDPMLVYDQENNRIVLIYNERKSEGQHDYAVLQFKRHRIYQRWLTKINQCEFDQKSFMDFIRYNREDILPESWAELQESLKSIKASKIITREEEYEKGHNMVLRIENRVGNKSQVELPEYFKIGVPIMDTDVGDILRTFEIELDIEAEEGKAYFRMKSREFEEAFDEACDAEWISVQARMGILCVVGHLSESVCSECIIGG